MISPFTGILDQVVASGAGIVGAVFVDWEGETVAQSPSRASQDLRLLGAHWGVTYYLARTASERLGQGAVSELMLRLEDQQVLMCRVTDEYLVIFSLDRDASLGRALYQVRSAVEALRGEM